MNLPIMLIAQYGVPLAYEIWNTWKDKKEPTEADWNALKARVAKSADDYEAAPQTG